MKDFDALAFSLVEKYGNQQLDEAITGNYNPAFKYFVEDPYKPAFEKLFRQIIPNNFMQQFGNNITDYSNLAQIPDPEIRKWMAIYDNFILNNGGLNFSEIWRQTSRYSGSFVSPEEAYRYLSNTLRQVNKSSLVTTVSAKSTPQNIAKPSALSKKPGGSKLGSFINSIDKHLGNALSRFDRSQPSIRTR